MGDSLRARLDDVIPKACGGQAKAGPTQSESDRKKLAEHRERERMQAVGKSIERALQILGVAKQDASIRMGYSDPGTVSRWCSGTERPHFDKLLFDIDGFEVAWLKARTERRRLKRVRVKTLIEIDETEAA